MLNDLPWKRTKIILSFLRLQPRYCILDSFVDHDGYSISSLGFLPTVVDRMVIWIKLALPVHFSSLIPRMLMFILTTSCLTISNFTLIHRPNIPVSYAILFFAASDFTFITRHIHKCSTFLLWPSCFILPGTISGSPLLFPTSILDTFQPGGLIFWCHIFLSFYTVHEVLTASILGCLLWIMFCQNSPLWPICLGWPYMAWFIASSSYASSFDMTSDLGRGTPDIEGDKTLPKVQDSLKSHTTK